jgi:hypothetical protein
LPCRDPVLKVNAEVSENGWAERFVAAFEQRDSLEFAQMADAVSRSGLLRTRTKMGLLSIAKADTVFQDFRTRSSAIKVIDLLGFSNEASVRHELYELFTSTFDLKRLKELSLVEAIPKAKGCGTHCLELKVLYSLLQSMLSVREEPGLSACRLTLTVFAGTSFAKKIERLLDEP